MLSVVQIHPSQLVLLESITNIKSGGKAMKCCKCGDGIESGKNFIPIESPGTPNRKWACEKCADLVQKQQARNVLGKEGLEVARIISPGFLQ